MRDFKGMKRQRGRNRGGGGGGKPQPQNANRAFDSNGPDGVKVRGNAQHVFEKYQQLARDANAAGDRVLGENYLQHAEHYFRLLRAIQPQRPASEILGRDQFASGIDIDFEDEGIRAQAEAADDAAEASEGREPRDTRDDGDNRDRREWQGQGDRQGGRDDRPARDDRPPRDDRQGGARDDRPARDDRQARDRDGAGGGRRDRWRDRRDRDDRPRAEGDDRPAARAERPERQDRDPLAVVEPQGGAPGASEERGPVLRDAEGGESQAPAFLQARTEPRPEASEEKPAPRRRRRAPRSFEAGDGSPSNESEEA